MNAALIVVAKKPEPGFTKTRLCPPFTPQDAAKFYRCLMLDTLELVTRLQGVAHCLAFTPPGARAYFQSMVPESFSLIPQSGGDLGERLALDYGRVMAAAETVWLDRKLVRLCRPPCESAVEESGTP